MTDRDNEMFLDTLEEACTRTGWRVHAFVLMGNHYHLLLETPEANLVDGMRWLQGTYTQRFNIRHKQRGHLFQGRYKALPVDTEGDYFSTVGSYIHLNPARAKCFDLENGKLSDYLWCSYRLYLRPSKRPEWLETRRMLGNLGLLDDRTGRAKYRQYMQKRVLEISCSEKPRDVDECWKKIRRGVMFGGDEFRIRMQEALGGVMTGNRRDSYSGELAKKHDESEAQKLLADGLKKLKLAPSALAGLKKCDSRKKVIAWIIRRRTIVRNEWISARLYMGRASNLSRFIKEVEECEEGELWRLKKMMIK